jgi:hypothetical protein
MIRSTWRSRFVVDSTEKQRRKRFYELFKRSGVGSSERKKKLPLLMSKPVAEIEELAQATSRNQTAATGVCSFAGDPLNILMWSHYASNHRGLCLQFDVASDPGLFTLPVEYSEEYPIVNWVTDFNKGVGDTLLRKHSGWSYERESRIILLENARQPYSFRPERSQP